MSAAQSASALQARPLRGATAAWSKNAQWPVTGNSARSAFQSITAPIVCRQETLDAAFQVQQKLFSPKTAAVTSELAALVNDPMARDHDGDSILAVRPADRALSAR